MLNWAWQRGPHERNRRALCGWCVSEAQSEWLVRTSTLQVSACACKLIFWSMEPLSESSGWSRSYSTRSTDYITCLWILSLFKVGYNSQRSAPPTQGSSLSSLLIVLAFVNWCWIFEGLRIFMLSRIKLGLYGYFDYFPACSLLWRSGNHQQTQTLSGKPHRKWCSCGYTIECKNLSAGLSTRSSETGSPTCVSWICSYERPPL